MQAIVTCTQNGVRFYLTSDNMASDIQERAASFCDLTAAAIVAGRERGDYSAWQGRMPWEPAYLLANGAIVPAEESGAGPAESDTDADSEPAFFAVAPYLVWRQYGGPEEGGWYYDAGEPALEAWLPVPVICKTRAEAYAARDVMQEALDADANVGLRDKYSVLSSGVYEAHVSYGYPHPFPVEQPFYE